MKHCNVISCIFEIVFELELTLSYYSNNQTYLNPPINHTEAVSTTVMLGIVGIVALLLG